MKFKSLIFVGFLILGCSTSEQKNNKNADVEKNVKDSAAENVQENSIQRYKNENDTVSDIIRQDFIKLCDKLKVQMESELRKVDTVSYNLKIKKLKELKGREVTSQDDDSLNEVDTLLKMQIAEAKSVEVDSKGIVIAGNILDSVNGKLELRSIQDTSGRILIISPQYVYRWPGDYSTACGVLDPRDGYWNVKKHIGYENPISTIISSKTKVAIYTSIQKYFNTIRHGWLMIKNLKGENLGWIHQDSVRFYGDHISDTFENENLFYREGFAKFMHGIWVEPDKYTALASDANGIQYGDRTIWDFGLGIYAIFRGGQNFMEMLSEDDERVKYSDSSECCNTSAEVSEICNMKVIPFFKGDEEYSSFGMKPNEFVITYNYAELYPSDRNHLVEINLVEKSFLMFDTGKKIDTLTVDNWLKK